MQQICSKNVLDYFRLFKIFDLKKLDKHGEVKLTHDKGLGRKVLHVDGNVSTQNYITLNTASQSCGPATSFSEQYLYLVGLVENGKNFCFQLTLHLNTKVYKVLYSTVYKSAKMTSSGVLQMPLALPSGKWTIVVIDLYELCQKYSQIDEIRMSFRLAAVEIRANSRIKNIYQSHTLYDPHSMPREMQLPKKSTEDFYSTYNYLVLREAQPTMQEQGEPRKEQGEPRKEQGEPKKEQAVEERADEKGRENQSRSRKKTESGRAPKQAKVGMKSIRRSKGEGSIELEPVDMPEDEEMPRKNMPPRPKVTIEASLAALEGCTLSNDGFSALGAFITRPVLFAVHKRVTCMSVHGRDGLKVVVGYSDGSLCVWDSLRKKSVVYLQSELKEIGLIRMGGEGASEKIYLVGRDRMKREIILILSQQEVLFRQVSNYSITDFVVAQASGQDILLSFGFENIRLWKLNPNNSIITGLGLYLGKMNRNVHYNSACLLGDGQALVADSSGYITKVCLISERVEGMKKVSENGLDHILNVSEWGQVMAVETSGNIKVLNNELELLEEYELGSRIKAISYRITGGNLLLQLSNFNHTLGQFNVTTSDYRYLSRQHCANVLGLAYINKLSKLVSISKDNTIRIWGLQIAQQAKSITPLEIKQEYQFLINSGETMTCLKTDQSQHAYIGFTGGIVRKVDVNNFEIIKEERVILGSTFEQEAQMESTTITSIDISKNGKNLLICCECLGKEKVYEKGQSSRITYVVLTDQDLNHLVKFQCPSPISGVNNGQNCRAFGVFNTSVKKMAICWCYGSINRLQSFSLSNPSEVRTEFYLHSRPRRLAFTGKVIQSHASNEKNQEVVEVYEEETGQMRQMLSLDGNWVGECMVAYPLCFSCSSRQQLQIGALEVRSASHVKEAIDMPEKISNFTLGTDSESDLVFCSGDESNALYAVRYQVRNMEELLAHNKVEEPIEEEECPGTAQKQEQSLSSIASVRGSRKEELGMASMGFSRNQFMPECFEQPRGVMGPIEEDFGDEEDSVADLSQRKIRSIYHQEEKIYEQVKHVLIPQQEEGEEQIGQHYDGQHYLQEEQQCRGVQALYGWQTRYSDDPDVQPQRLIWKPSQQAVMLASKRTLIRHEFREPVVQSLLRLPARPGLIVELGKYLGVCMGNQLRLYSCELGYMRAMTALGTVIRSAAVSQCEGFAVVVSCGADHTYIQVMDMLTCQSVCNSYLRGGGGQVRVVINPYHKCLEFVLVWGSCFRFYQMSSIMTLQTQEDQEVRHILNNTDTGAIHSVYYLKLAQEELLLLGTRDGSLIIVDSRTASVLILCRKVVNHPIADILHCFDDPIFTVALVGHSSVISSYRLEQLTVQSFISALDKKPFGVLTVDSEITANSSLHSLSHGTQGMLAMTKFGVLWLLDLTGNDTIKISSVHIGPSESGKGSLITKCVALGETEILTGGSDGTIKCTSLMNLEQSHEIFKPRKSVQDIVVCNELMLVAVEQEVSFYSQQKDARSERWKFLGSVNLQGSMIDKNERVVSVRNIPYSDNYFICTDRRLLMVYHHQASTSNLKVEMQEICGGLNHSTSIDVLGYNHVLIRTPSSVHVWLRKQAPNQRPVEELSRVQQLRYYMMDAYQANPVQALFVTEHMDKGSVARQYITLLADRPLLQWRDFTEHAIVRELKIGVEGPTCMQIPSGEEFLIGDESGTVWCIKQNGLTLEKQKAIDGPIEGIESMSDGKLAVYGEQLAIIRWG